jgi:hypothetical protein
MSTQNRDAALAKILLIANNEGSAQPAMKAPREANAPNRLTRIKDNHDVLVAIDAAGVPRRPPVVVLPTSRPVENVTKADDLQADCRVQEPVDLKDSIAVATAIGKFRPPTVVLPPGFDGSRNAERAPAAF